MWSMCALEREEQFAEHQCCLHSKEQPAHPGAVRSSFFRGQVETLGTGYWVDGKQVCEKSFPSKGSGDSLWVSSSRTGFKYWSTVINDVTLGLMLVSQVSTAALHPCPLQDVRITWGLTFHSHPWLQSPKKHFLGLCPSLYSGQALTCT